MYAEESTKSLLWDTNYDRGNNGYIRTIYVHLALNQNGVIFLQILHDIVPFARHFLPVKIYPKYCFNKL